MLIIAITSPTFYSWVWFPTHSELVLLVSLGLPYSRRCLQEARDQYLDLQHRF